MISNFKIEFKNSFEGVLGFWGFGDEEHSWMVVGLRRAVRAQASAHPSAFAEEDAAPTHQQPQAAGVRTSRPMLMACDRALLRLSGAASKAAPRQIRATTTSHDFSIHPETCTRWEDEKVLKYEGKDIPSTESSSELIQGKDIPSITPASELIRGKDRSSLRETFLTTGPGSP